MDHTDWHPADIIVGLRKKGTMLLVAVNPVLLFVLGVNFLCHVCYLNFIEYSD